MWQTKPVLSRISVGCLPILTQTLQCLIVSGQTIACVVKSSMAPSFVDLAIWWTSTMCQDKTVTTRHVKGEMGNVGAGPIKRPEQVSNVEFSSVSDSVRASVSPVSEASHVVLSFINSVSSAI